MKLLTLRVDGALHAGVQVGDDVLDLVRAAATMAEAAGVPATVRGILAGGTACRARIDRVVGRAEAAPTRAALVASGAWRPLAEAALGPVVPDPAMFLSIGANSRGHLAEMNDAPPPSPEFFFKVRSAISASGDPIEPPPGYGDMLDWEGELCAVIGKRCHRVSPAEAEDHIAGYTLTNDVSARDNVRQFVGAEGRHAVVTAFRILTQLKNFPGFSPLGPVLATRDEFPAVWDYQLETLVNGETVQRSNAADLVFTPAQILSYFSEFYVFEPGDVFSLGSPPGVGMAMKPPRFLKPGDRVEVRAAEIGVLVNTVGALPAS